MQIKQCQFSGNWELIQAITWVYIDLQSNVENSVDNV